MIQSSQAAASFVSSGGMRAIVCSHTPESYSVEVNNCFLLVTKCTMSCVLNFLTVLQVELLIPQLQFLDDEGAQLELWELSRVFLDTLIEETQCQVWGLILEVMNSKHIKDMKNFLDSKCFSFPFGRPTNVFLQDAIACVVT